MIRDFVICARSRIPVSWLVTHEERRAERALSRWYAKQRGELWIWSLTSSEDYGPGWQPPREVPRKKAPFDEEMSQDPTGAISSVIKYATDQENKTKKIGIVIRDPHPFVKQDASFVRILRDAAWSLKGTQTSIMCISPESSIPEDLRKDIEVIFPGLPPKEVLRKIMREQVEEYKKADEVSEVLKESGPEFIDKLADACCGLTLDQATDALAKSMMVTRGNPDIQYISEIKTRTISSVPGLTYIGQSVTMDDIGGLAGLKEYMTERKGGFTQEARDFNLPVPRGILCIGISGCGKSLFAKAVAADLDLPLISLSLPDVKGGIVGETESNFRSVKQAIEALGNCVVWLDEMEKMLPKAGTRNSDGGTSDALLQGILNWMQERKEGAFLVATANDISGLPPELLRKGRWDAIFFVDLPEASEREEIFRIHLAKVHRELSGKDVEALAERTNGYSGAEIEAAVIDGLWRAWGDGAREITKDDIITCIRMDVPLSQTMKESVNALRKWAATRARSASLTAAASKVNIPGGRKVELQPEEEENYE